MQCWHLTFSSIDRMPLFSDEGARRAAVRMLFRVLERCLVLFCLVDDHGHLVVICPVERLGRLKAALGMALGPIVASPIGPIHAKPIESRAHLVRMVPYLLRQTAHHGLAAHAATWSGSCFHDLLGARQVQGAGLRLFELLPRMRVESLFEHVGLSTLALSPAPDEIVRAAGAVRAVRAAAAAACAHPDLRGKQRPVIRARRAAAELGRQAGLAPADIAWALDVTPRTLRRIAGRPIDGELVHAARLQIALLNACAGIPVRTRPTREAVRAG